MANHNSTPVTDEQGNRFPSLQDACIAYGGTTAPGGSYRTLANHGVYNYKGHTFTASEKEAAEMVHDVCTTTTDPLLERLRERYTDEELEMISKGQGIQKHYIPYPEIHIRGEHHRMVVVSDTHIGSIYAPEEWHDVVSSFVNEPDNGVECVLHCGDIVDGMKLGRQMQIYELTDIGFDAQRDKAIALMRKYDRPVYIISGNHDMYFKESAGADIVKAICEAVPNMTYIGHDSADIELGGVTIRLFHGGDGSSYAVSYRLQKLVEAINGGHKPNILLAGHAHKVCYTLSRNIHAISVPCMQAQTKYMEAKKLAAHTGFLVLDFDSINGGVCNLSVQYVPFYA